jgi:hypothetical protein
MIQKRRLKSYQIAASAGLSGPQTSSFTRPPAKGDIGIQTFGKNQRRRQTPKHLMRPDI